MKLNIYLLVVSMVAVPLVSAGENHGAVPTQRPVVAEGPCTEISPKGAASIFEGISYEQTRLVVQLVYFAVRHVPQLPPETVRDWVVQSKTGDAAANQTAESSWLGAAVGSGAAGALYAIYSAQTEKQVFSGLITGLPFSASALGSAAWIDKTLPTEEGRARAIIALGGRISDLGRTYGSIFGWSAKTTKQFEEAMRSAVDQAVNDAHRANPDSPKQFVAAAQENIKKIDPLEIAGKVDSSKAPMLAELSKLMRSRRAAEAALPPTLPQYLLALKELRLSLHRLQDGLPQPHGSRNELAALIGQIETLEGHIVDLCILNAH